MAKKDFTGANTGRVYNQIAEATAEPETPATHDAQETQDAQRAYNTQETQQELETGHKPYKPRMEYTAQEAEEYARKGQTRGRKGCKMVRINMAFPFEVHEFIKAMARVRGETITDFTAHVFRQYMAEHMDTYRKAQEFRDSL